jgi:hypothetical protein
MIEMDSIGKKASDDRGVSETAYFLATGNVIAGQSFQ